MLFERMRVGRARARAARRAAERRAAVASGSASTLPAIPGLIGRNATPVQPGRRGGTAGFVVSVAAAAGTMLAALAGATPLAGGSLLPYHLVSGLMVSTAAGLLSVRLSRTVARRTMLAAYIAAGGMVALFALGSATQLIVDGTPQPAGGTVDRVDRVAGEMMSDWVLAASADRLITYDDATARALLREYGPAADELEAAALRWAGTPVEQLPDGRLGPAVRHLYIAADLAGQALRTRRELALEYSGRGEEDLAGQRAAMQAELARARQAIDEVVEVYGLPVEEMWQEAGG